MRGGIEQKHPEPRFEVGREYLGVFAPNFPHNAQGDLVSF